VKGEAQALEQPGVEDTEVPAECEVWVTDETPPEFVSLEQNLSAILRGVSQQFNGRIEKPQRTQCV